MNKGSTFLLFLLLPFCFFTRTMQWQQKYTLLSQKTVTDAQGYITQQKKLFCSRDTANRLTLNEIVFCPTYNIRNLWTQKNDSTWIYSRTLCTPIRNDQLIPPLEIKYPSSLCDSEYFLLTLFCLTISQIRNHQEKKVVSMLFKKIDSMPPFCLSLPAIPVLTKESISSSGRSLMQKSSRSESREKNSRTIIQFLKTQN